MSTERLQAYWDERARNPGFHSVLTRRWSDEDCARVNDLTQRLFADGLMEASPTDPILLDLGCGVGRLTGSLADHARWVIGLDYSRSMVERAQRDSQRPNALFMTGSATDLPFVSETFDCVVVSAVLQHLSGPAVEGACAEIARVLRGQGTVLLLEGVTESARMHESPSSASHHDVAFYERLWAGTLQLEVSTPVLLIEDEYVFSRWTRTTKSA